MASTRLRSGGHVALGEDFDGLLLTGALAMAEI
jgi:hypothetical protein